MNNHLPIQRLESRTLLAVSFDDGTLRVVGGKRFDLVALRMVADDRFEVSTRYEKREFDVDDVRRIEISTRGAGDIVTNKDVPLAIEVDGGAGPDTITGGPGDDLLFGAGGRDDIRAGAGDDTIIGGLHGDWLQGDAGDDRLVPSVEDDRDTVIGGRGTDTVDYPANSAGLDLRTFVIDGKRALYGTSYIVADVEALNAGLGDDYIRNRTRKSIALNGGGGNDTLLAD